MNPRAVEPIARRMPRASSPIAIQPRRPGPGLAGGGIVTTLPAWWHRGTEVDIDQREPEEGRLAAEGPVADPVGHRGPAGASAVSFGTSAGSASARMRLTCRMSRTHSTAMHAVNATNQAPQAIKYSGRPPSVEASAKMPMANAMEISSMRRPARRVASRSRRVGAAWAVIQVPNHPPHRPKRVPRILPSTPPVAPAPAAAFHAPVPAEAAARAPLRPPTGPPVRP